MTKKEKDLTDIITQKQSEVDSLTEKYTELCTTVEGFIVSMDNLMKLESQDKVPGNQLGKNLSSMITTLEQRLTANITR